MFSMGLTIAKVAVRSKIGNVYVDHERLFSEVQPY